jgi:flagellin-like protein
MQRKMKKQNKNGRYVRNGLFASRKAVSPLIATVLLIAFAVALGAVVMNWGRGYVEDTANMARERSDAEVTCTAEVDLSIVQIDNTPQICYNTTSPGHVHMILENTKAKEIERFEVRLIGEDSRVPLAVTSFTDLDDVEQTGSNLSLETNEAKYYVFEFDESTYGAPNQIKITPYVKAGGNVVACSSNAEVATTIKTCTVLWD